jgi:hypothetical protein
MQVPIPTSVIFKKFNILHTVPARPINSSPRHSKKIRREKKDIKIDKK